MLIRSVYATAAAVLTASAAQAVPWTPADMSTVAWYDAADAATLTSSDIEGVQRVSAWTDKSGNGNDLSQGSDNKKPATGTRSLNGLNVLDFDPNPADSLIGASKIAWDNVYVVTFSDDMSFGNRPTALGGANTLVYTVQFNNNGGGPDPDSWLGGGYYVNGEASTAPGADAALVTAGPTLVRRANSYDNVISVGSDRQLNNRGWDGTIAEVVYLFEADPIDMQRVEGYLMWKWGLEANLPTDHPYKTAAPESASLLGDFDGDGDVDGVDVAEMFSNFNGPGGGAPTNPDTDLDNDGDADGVDVATLFGVFTGPSAPATVPEPTSLALLGMGGLLAYRRR